MNETRPQLRIVLVGCGQIADAHLQEIAKVDCARVVAVCDIHRDLADQAAARFGVPAAYDNLEQMLDVERPDVAHITTPAHTHAPLAMQVVERGCHAYVEKPFALDAAEADGILCVADEHSRKVCLGHDQLFDPVWIEARRRIAAGEIGAVRHVESVLGYALDGQFGAAMKSDPNHWVRRLPGGLFQNTISHPLYRITDLMTDERPGIDAQWFSRRELEIPTELRVHLRGRDVTGSLVFDTGIEPQRITRVYGTQGNLEADLDAQVVRRHRKPGLPGAFGKLEAPWRQWREAGRNLRRNISRFLRSDLHYFAGMGNLFEQFYRSILDDADPPIPYSEMRRVTRIMDGIFDLCRERSCDGVMEYWRNGFSCCTAPSLHHSTTPSELV